MGREDIKKLAEELESADNRRKVEILNELSVVSAEDSPEKAIQYGERALKLARKIGDRKGEANSLSNISKAYIKTGAYEKALEYQNKSLEIWEEVDNQSKIANSLHNIGVIYYFISNYPDALKYFKRAFFIRDKIGDTKGLSQTLNNLGIICRNTSKYEDALKYYGKSLEIKEKTDDARGIADTLTNISIIYKEINNFDKALQYQEEALSIFEDIGDKYGIALSLNNIGIIHKRYDNPDTSLEYFRSALKIFEELKNKSGMVDALNNIATSYQKLNNPVKALEYYKKSLGISEEIANQRKIALLSINIGNIYGELDDYESALKYIERGKELAQKIGLKTIIQSSYEMLTELYSAKQDFEKALEYHRLYTKIKDEILNEETSKQLTEMQVRYETERKEREAEIYRLKNVELAESNRKLTEANEKIERQKTELERTLDELRRTQKQLVESEKMASLGSLVAGVAHEINTPVGIGITAASSLMEDIKNFTELYNRDEITTSDFEEFVQSAYETAKLLLSNLQRTGNLIQSFKQISVDQFTEQRREFKLKSYIDDIIVSLKPKFAGKDIELTIDCDEELTLNSYPGAFAQIFTNLIINSIIHGFRDRDSGEISISVKSDGEKLSVSYSDNGVGISAENIPKIFDPFFTTNKQIGTGLGLNIVYNIITQKLGGSIECKSQPKKETKFDIIIPLSGGKNEQERQKR
ncbi:hypothetical protein DRQ33_01465 [bacterium]|nr:MAG: hypothetical protein DRQ33_01465 [bacterium]